MSILTNITYFNKFKPAIDYTFDIAGKIRNIISPYTKEEDCLIPYAHNEMNYLVEIVTSEKEIRYIEVSRAKEIIETHARKEIDEIWSTIDIELYVLGFILTTLNKQFQMVNDQIYLVDYDGGLCKLLFEDNTEFTEKINKEFNKYTIAQLPNTLETLGELVFIKSQIIGVINHLLINGVTSLRNNIHTFESIVRPFIKTFTDTETDISINDIDISSRHNTVSINYEFCDRDSEQMMQYTVVYDFNMLAKILYHISYRSN